MAVWRFDSWTVAQWSRVPLSEAVADRHSHDTMYSTLDRVGSAAERYRGRGGSCRAAGAGRAQRGPDYVLYLAVSDVRLQEQKPLVKVGGKVAETQRTQHAPTESLPQ